MKENNRTLEDISALDVLSYFKNNLKKILLSTATGIAAGVIYIAIFTGKYYVEAEIYLEEMGHVYLEDPQKSIEKFKTPAFFSERTNTMCQLGDGKYIKIRTVEKLNPTYNKILESIKISFAGENLQDVRGCIDWAIKDINGYYYNLAVGELARVRGVISLGQVELQSVGKRNLNVELRRATLGEYYQRLLRELYEKRLIAQAIERVIHDSDMGNKNIYATSIYVPEEKIRLRPVVVILLGALMGFVFGVMMRPLVNLVLYLNKVVMLGEK